MNKNWAEKLDYLVILYLGNTFIYIEDHGQDDIKGACWMLQNLRNHSIFTNFKKSYVYQKEVCVLIYVVSSQIIRKKEEKIEAVKTGSELK